MEVLSPRTVRRAKTPPLLLFTSTNSRPTARRHSILVVPAIQSIPGQLSRVQLSREADILSEAEARGRAKSTAITAADSRRAHLPKLLSRDDGSVRDATEDSRFKKSPVKPRSKSLSALPGGEHQRLFAQLAGAYTTNEMARHSSGGGGDLFLELARAGDAKERAPSRSERASGRLPSFEQRHSLLGYAAAAPASDQRPKSSGGALSGRRPSQQGAFPPDFQRQAAERYRNTPNRASFNFDDSASVSGRSISGRARHSTLPEASPLSPSRLGHRMRSSELSSFGKMRPSYGADQVHAPKVRPTQHDAREDSPEDSSEPKHSHGSTSVDSDTADTVWDELDELKTRIKKLEYTGKALPNFGAGISGDSSERPRTATTAPTTIDSSPQHERKTEAKIRTAIDPNITGGTSIANIHPLLHSALAKTKPLISPALYRTLEATATDALQLAAMTGGAGPQGTAFSAASIINGVTVSDRHVRRKADTMCRNLTDLCLALCEGKNEAPVTIAPALVFEPVRSISTMRHSRSITVPGDISDSGPARPMSRLEARRTSILGPQRLGSQDNSPRATIDDVSASEQEGTPSHIQQPPRDLRRVSRTGSRMLSARMPCYDEVSGDDDPTVRPPSRAMTDIGKLRGKPSSGQQEYKSPASLRDSLTVRRAANSGTYESNRESSSRVASLSSDTGRRRWVKESTPPVVEEEGNGSDYQPSSQQPRQRRMASLGQFRERLSAGTPNRATSMSSRRGLAVE